MADFEYGYLEGSRVEYANGHTVVRATNGAVKMRQLYPSNKKVFDLQFMFTASEKSAVDSIYSNKRASTLTFKDIVDQTTYTVVFSEPPSFSRIPSGMWSARIKFEEA